MLHTKYQSSMPSSFREEDFQRFCYFFHSGCHGNQSYDWQPELWLEFNLLNNFGRASPKEYPCQVSSRLAQWFMRRRCLKKLWTMHDGLCMTDARHWAITKAHHEHFVLRWAKKGHNSEKKRAFWIVSLDRMDCSLDSEHILQVSSKFLQKQRYYKMPKFLHDDNANNDTKAIAIPQAFSENSQAKNKTY